MLRVWESIAPIVPSNALPNRVSPIGPSVSLEAVPVWFKKEREYAEKELGKREAFSSEACLNATFHGEGLGSIVEGAPLGKKRRNYETSWEVIRIANLALWLARPSSLHVEFVITAEPEASPGGSAIKARSLESIRPNEKYAGASLTYKDLGMADKLATAMQSIPYPSSLWTAIRFLWLALTEEVWETRYVNLWVTIEALFGPENRKAITQTLAKRVARFLNTDLQEARVAYQLVKEGYRWRSAAVHGSRLSSLSTSEASDVMLKAEGMVLTSLRKILPDSALIGTFSSSSRDAYLDALTKGFQP